MKKKIKNKTTNETETVGPTCFVVDRGGDRLVGRPGAAAAVHGRADRHQQATDGDRSDHGRGCCGGLHLVRARSR